MGYKMRIDLDDPIRDAKQLKRNKYTYQDEMNDALSSIGDGIEGFVHVQSGSLQASMKLNNKTVGDTWSGEITHGGDSPIPHSHGWNGWEDRALSKLMGKRVNVAKAHYYVEYAGYEIDRGMGHNFLEWYQTFDEPILERAIIKGVFE